MWRYDHDVLLETFVKKGREKLIKKIDRITTLLGLGALIIFMPMTGYMFGWLITVESQNDSWIGIEDVYAEGMTGATGITGESVEGFKYKVTISDGIGTSDDLK